MPLALLNLPVAIALWIPTPFVSVVSAFRYGPNEAACSSCSRGSGSWRASGGRSLNASAPSGRVLLAVAALITWMLLSMAWAPKSDIGSEIFFAWLIAGAIVLIGVSSSRTIPRLRLAAGAFRRLGLPILVQLRRQLRWGNETDFSPKVDISGLANQRVSVEMRVHVARDNTESAQLVVNGKAYPVVYGPTLTTGSGNYNEIQWGAGWAQLGTATQYLYLDKATLARF